MPQPVDRSVQRQLQQVVGTLGAVQPYRHTTDRQHRSVGWYVTPRRARQGCRCAYCTAKRARADLYLGYNRTDAVVEAELAARAHTGATAAAA